MVRRRRKGLDIATAGKALLLQCRTSFFTGAGTFLSCLSLPQYSSWPALWQLLCPSLIRTVSIVTIKAGKPAHMNTHRVHMSTFHGVGSGNHILWLVAKTA